MKRFKIVTVVVTALFLLSSALPAMELVRQKNVATYIAFPLMKNDGTRISAAAGVGVYYSTMTASGVALTTSTVDGTLTEVTADSGMYKLALSQAEMNNDYLVLTATSTTANAVPQTILIRTTTGNPHLLATTDDGGTINVTGGAIDTVTTATTATNLTNAPTNGDLTATMKTSVTTAATSSTPALSAAGVTAIWDNDISGFSTAGYAGTYLKYCYDNFVSTWTATLAPNLLKLDATISSRGTSTLTTSDNIGINWADVTNPTTAVNLSGTNIKTDQVVASVSGAVGSVSGGVTVITNNDKTGYTVSTVSDKTGYSLAAGQLVTVSSTTAAAQADIASVIDSKALATASALATAQADLDNPSQYKADTTTIPSGVVTAMQVVAGDFKADVSGLSTYDGSDTTGTTTLLTRLSGARAGYLDYLIAIDTNTTHTDLYMVNSSTWTVARANKLEYLDAAISGITATVAVADIQAGLDANGYTAARGAYLDYLDMAISDVTATVSVADIQAGMTAQGYTATRAAYLDTIPTIYTKLDLVYTYTNGAKDSGAYNGIELMIRGAR